jgi:hypothetical protein
LVYLLTDPISGFQADSLLNFFKRGLIGDRLRSLRVAKLFKIGKLFPSFLVILVKIIGPIGDSPPPALGVKIARQLFQFFA